METITEYQIWEAAVTGHISKLRYISYGDASGIVEAHEFEMAQCWIRDISAKETALIIINKK